MKAALNIGIYLASNQRCGGIYQYDCNLVNILKRYDKENNYFVFALSKDIEIDDYREERWEIIYLDDYVAGLIYKLIAKWYSKILSIKDGLFKKRNEAHVIHSAEDTATAVSGLRDWLNDNLLYRQFRKRSMDLMIYPSLKPHRASVDIPFIVAIHDLQHLINPGFPEVSSGGEWAQRQSYYKNVTKQALAILVDSEVGKEDIIKHYNVPVDKVKVLPYLLPKHHIGSVTEECKKSIREKYDLTEGYLFYPAQFWPHKNHLRLINALYSVKKIWGVSITLVLTGNKDVSHSTFKEVMNLSKELSVDDQVKYLGFVPSKDILPLYAMASALVMPTFFGPTNIPVVEAFLLGCPVVTSCIRGIREQVGDAGLLVDPESVDDLAKAIHRVYTDKELRRNLIERGFKKVGLWTEADFAKRLISVIDYCEKKLRLHRER